MNKRILRTTGPGLVVITMLAAAAGLQGQQTGVPAQQGAADSVSMPSVTLDQAVQLTLQHSPTMVQAQGQVRTTGASQLSAYGNFLPSLSFSSGASKSSSVRFNQATNQVLSSSNPYNYNAGLSASMDLFSGGRNVATLHSANAQSDAADASLIQQQFQVTLNAKTQFFNVLRAGELVTVAQAQLAQAQQGLDAANERMRVGSATRSDVLRAQLSVTQSKQSLLQAQTNLSSDQFALGRLVGQSGPVTATPPSSLEPMPLAVPESQLPAMVEAQSPQVVSASANVKQAHASVTVARAQYFPTVSLSSSYNWSNNQLAITGPGSARTWSMGLRMSYPIFNGFSREQSMESANVQSEDAEASLNDARLAARASLEADLAQLKQAALQIQYSQEAVQSAEEDLRVQLERYRLGAGTMLDRLTSQAALVQAQTNAVNARYDYQIARAQLEALVGRSL